MMIMSDDNKQRVLLGGLLSVVLGMGSWYLVFGGTGSAEQPEVMKERVQVDRYANANGDGPRDKPNRHENSIEPVTRRIQLLRDRDPNRGWQPKSCRPYTRGKRKSHKFTTPVAFALPVAPTREA